MRYAFNGIDIHKAGEVPERVIKLAQDLILNAPNDTFNEDTVNESLEKHGYFLHPMISLSIKRGLRHIFVIRKLGHPLPNNKSYEKYTYIELVPDD